MRGRVVRHSLCAAICAGACVAGAFGIARADQINVSTGLDSSNNLITTGGAEDAHWTVSEQAGGSGFAQVVEMGDADWYGDWAADGPNSDWIARDASNRYNGPGQYTFYTTFDLTNFDLSTVALSGSWAVDDGGTVNLNGHQLASLYDEWSSLSSFSAPNADFVQGLNTLSITITDNNNDLEAVRLEGSVTGTENVSAAPLPASAYAGMTLLASLGIGAALRRRRAHGAA